MSLRYIGSKARIVKSIMNCVGAPDGGVFIDAFSGTGAVAEAASMSGWPVHVNDHLKSSAIMSFSRLISERSVPFTRIGGYVNAINELNILDPIDGFIWREYSPASVGHRTVARMYFTEDNARKIDAVRQKIRIWRDNEIISLREERVLISDLMRAANRVANTAGTYGCFLSKWQMQSLAPIVLETSILPKNPPKASMSTNDVRRVRCAPSDTVYLDPPYTKRQYAAYYHILETIALGDAPIVSGVCGIRPWWEKASAFCYKTKAVNAISELISHIPSRRIFLSYSTEGHAPINHLSKEISSIAELHIEKLSDIGRYRPNKIASKTSSSVSELLFCIRKTKKKGYIQA